MNYHWNWKIFWDLSPTGDGHLPALRSSSGLGWTLATALAAWVIALAARLGRRHAAHDAHRNGSCASATRYVELFRNIPLLVQMFLWFFVMPELAARRTRRRGSSRCPRRGAPIVPAVLCLGLFTSVRVAEQVRAGIQSLPRGQRMAGTALGLTLPQTYRYRAPADGLPHHPAAAHLRVPEHHQELVGGADDRAARAHRRARARCRSSASRCSRRSPRRRCIYLVTNLVVVLAHALARAAGRACRASSAGAASGAGAH